MRLGLVLGGAWQGYRQAKEEQFLQQERADKEADFKANQAARDKISKLPQVGADYGPADGLPPGMTIDELQTHGVLPADAPRFATAADANSWIAAQPKPQVAAPAPSAPVSNGPPSAPATVAPSGVAPTYTASTPPTASSWQSPLATNLRITSGFGQRAIPTPGASANHMGIDYHAPANTPVGAMMDGKVIFAGQRGGYGNAVEIQHPNGYTSLYGHLNQIGVKPGDTITAGAPIGLSGATGVTTGPHLHVGVKDPNGKWVNPSTLLTSGPGAAPGATASAVPTPAAATPTTPTAPPPMPAEAAAAQPTLHDYKFYTDANGQIRATTNLRQWTADDVAEHTALIMLTSGSPALRQQGSEMLTQLKQRQIYDQALKIHQDEAVESTNKAMFSQALAQNNGDSLAAFDTVANTGPYHRNGVWQRTYWDEGRKQYVTAHYDTGTHDLLDVTPIAPPEVNNSTKFQDWAMSHAGANTTADYIARSSLAATQASMTRHYNASAAQTEAENAAGMGAAHVGLVQNQSKAAGASAGLAGAQAGEAQAQTGLINQNARTAQIRTDALSVLQKPEGHTQQEIDQARFVIQATEGRDTNVDVMSNGQTRMTTPNGTWALDGKFGWVPAKYLGVLGQYKEIADGKITLTPDQQHGVLKFSFPGAVDDKGRPGAWDNPVEAVNAYRDAQKKRGIWGLPALGGGGGGVDTAAGGVGAPGSTGNTD